MPAFRTPGIKEKIPVKPLVKAFAGMKNIFVPCGVYLLPLERFATNFVFSISAFRSRVFRFPVAIYLIRDVLKRMP